MEILRIFFYYIYPKSTYMLKHLTNREQVDKWTDLYVYMKKIWISSLVISLISYSPEDPNFIFPENAEIKNFLGAKGSYASDIFYQSIGLISLLVPISFFFISLSVIIDKKILYVVESLFFIILYSITGTLFFTVFH